jgi:pyruvate/2-oxoglutarate dehydrogenase complex dihydrolipoamide acyltransferase (E2) component
MPLFRRYEGEPIRGLSATHRIEPFIMTRRNESAVYYELPIQVTRLLAYLDEPATRQRRVSFFHVMLCAMIRALGSRPYANRFIVGHQIYQRKWIDISFAVKKEFTDDAGITMVKVRFEKDDTVDQVAQRVEEAIAFGRSGEKSHAEKEMSVLLALPGFILRGIVWLLRLLDRFNLMPASMIQADQLYASIVVANLGSIGMGAPFHHLYEWGTAPLFCVIGKIAKAPVVDENDQVVARDVVVTKWTLDERVIDGFYLGSGLEQFKHLVENPRLLESPPSEGASAGAVPGTEMVA